ncbi:MAG: signal peptidase I [Deltaproteobacteria bacterium]|nr:signal peptidase I [Deltaproteobacteria bacterium]MCZ6624991.1 signal peptidase I [Deltaproteobacteria bacterium]
MPSKKAKSTFREYAEAIGMALLLALFIRTFMVQAFKIPSGSMIPTLEIGDHILVSKLAYGIRIPYWGKYIVEFKKPQRGDVVVFIFPEDHSKDFIKRVIGVGGDLVKIRGKKIYINNLPVDDSHAHFQDNDSEGGGFQIRDDYGPRRVPENHVFVMGDNRDRSYDSRFWGFVNLEAVKGKAFLIYWSWEGHDRWVRWERIGDLIY